MADYENGALTWDLLVRQEPVTTLPEMLEWLGALGDDDAAQRASVHRYLEMNARHIPDDLFEALVAFAQGRP